MLAIIDFVTLVIVGICSARFRFVSCFKTFQKILWLLGLYKEPDKQVDPIVKYKKIVSTYWNLK